MLAARCRGYTSHVELRVITSEETCKVGGTVLGHDPRIVSINDYPIELKPEGARLICSNYDRPGAVGKVGTVLGNAGVNISGMQLSRAQEDGLALFALTLDQVPPESVLDILRNMTDVIRTLSMVRF
ncbi:hypothetical protein BH24DEI1_BH24DEI1_18890 [soil metagenome]